MVQAALTKKDRQKTLRRKQLWALNSGICYTIGRNAAVRAVSKTCTTSSDWQSSIISSLRSKSPVWMEWQMADHLPTYLPTASPIQNKSYRPLSCKVNTHGWRVSGIFCLTQKCHNTTWHVLLADFINSFPKILVKAYPATKCLIISTRDVQGRRPLS